MRSLDLIKKIAPEIIDIVEKRYLILRAISYNQPIGRRTLSTQLDMKERTIRDEVDILKDKGLLNVDFVGMYITNEGKDLIRELNEIYGSLKGIPELEIMLKKILGIKKVIIVPGNLLEDRMILKDMGKITSKLIKDSVNSGDILGITGGSTMAAVAEAVVDDNKSRDITVIPARGGLGKDVNTQSNSIAAKLGEKLGGSYRLLYVPDGLEEEALELMLKNSEIRESVEMIENMDSLVFGIGRADDMAKRRNLSDDKIRELLDHGAVAEAFGHYFDIDGREIWEYKTIGITLKKYRQLENIIGVAGGEKKAQAIVAISTLNENMTLVTDQAAAKKILEIVY